MAALTPLSALAHGTPAELSVWGNFGPTTARCQRALGRAAAYCVGRVLAIRSDCLGGAIAGEPCDQAAADEAVERARLRASDLVARACTANDLQLLRYLDLGDAQTDVIDVCRGLDTATRTAAYGPVLIGGTVAQVDGGEQACLEASGRAATRLLRFAMRARATALDQIAATSMSLAEKQARLERSERAIARARELSAERILRVCPAEAFTSLYGRGVGDVLGGIAARADCLSQSVYVQNAIACPPAVCGDGMQVTPIEECDDGNSYEGDGCRNDCIKTECDVFPTTYDLIQKALFDNNGCAASLCHDGTPGSGGGLDLRPGHSYASLVDVASQTALGWKRIEPGNHDDSLLWRNLAARTLGDPDLAPIRGMPLVGPAVSADELEALRIWIEQGGAARDANVPAAAALLDACVPEPEPVKIEPLDPPPAGTGVQLRMPAWTLDPHSESEVCFASYYDFTGRIPAALLSEDGQRFRYKSIRVRQDPLSHHLIVKVFNGPEAPNDPVWGAFACNGGEHAGQICDPLDTAACGSGQCATAPDPTTIACAGFGATEGLGTLSGGSFVVAQETSAYSAFPPQVFDELPLKGLLLWNSHAFNVTREAGSLEAWLNIEFPAPDDQVYLQQTIFDASQIFWVPIAPPYFFPQLAAFEDMEVCNLHEFRPPSPTTRGGSDLLPGETAHLFELSGHMHQRGVRFQIFRGAFTCAGGSKAGAACSPFQPEMCPGSACVDEGGRDPQDALLYTNYVYNDPLVLRFADPIAISGSAPRADRTLTYCGHYDNGTPPNIQKVKRRSTSPPPGMVFNILAVGGPCTVQETRCIGGPRHNQLCNGRHAACESSPGAGDGDCDACPLTGGFRTQDEMFILFGNYWVTR